MFSLISTGNAANNRALAVEKINAKSDVTGVKAIDDGDGVKLVAADGRNITIYDIPHPATSAHFGLSSKWGTTTGATINLTYVAPEGKTGNIQFSTGVMNFNGGDYKIIEQGTTVNAIDISTVDGANQSLAAVDAALKSINTARADLGAMQNRFGSVVTSLQASSENLSAARNRIVDADFAAETANLIRAQILQQSGVAMLTQAIALPNNVLALLKSLSR
jgi:flagellin